MRTIFLLISLVLVGAAVQSDAAERRAPVRLAIYGLPHDHVHGFIPAAASHPDVRLVGIIEPDRALAERFAGLYQVGTNLLFPTLEALRAATNVEAVAVFTSTFDHGKAVEECAPHGIHVMMEKPLAVNLAEARRMQSIAEKARIHLIVNYETTWYPGNHAAFDIVRNQKGIGDLRKIVVHDGHQGPKEIGCSPVFLKWLTDPVLNGGGALTDFGCYGANLITWLMAGEKPTSVFAVTQQIKPDVYPRVDDEATIVLTYPKMQGIIQASWNWPYNRKDMEVYGKSGYVLVPSSDMVKVLKDDGTETELTPKSLRGAQSNPIAYFVAVVRGEVQPSGLSSLENNMTVMEILEAARESARTGRRVELNSPPR
jgi:predicted dehydrogenase